MLHISYTNTNPNKENSSARSTLSIPLPPSASELRASIQPRRSSERLTRSLLRLVARHGADDGVLLPDEPVRGALYVAFSLGGLVLCFALGVFFFARGLPGFGAGEVADLEGKEGRDV